MLLSAEDGLADTLRPRMDKLGVDARKVWALNEHITLDESGLEELEELISQARPVAVIIDPLVAYMGGSVDLHKANETREIMAGLAKIAERQDCAVICVRHLRKGGADKSIYRGIGSIDLTAAARSVLLVGKNPDDPEERAIVHIKSNLAPLQPTQTYRLDQSLKSKNPFKWTGTSDLTSQDILKDGTGKQGPSELQS